MAAALPAYAASQSSAGSEARSVALFGKEMPLREAIETVIRGVQGRLNELQSLLYRMADEEILLEQSVCDEDDEASFRRRTDLEDIVQDTAAALIELVEELPDIAMDLRGAAPTKETKSWFSLHKKERKLELSRRKEAAKARAASEKAEELAAKEKALAAGALAPSAGPR
jgi:hypothetical protein